MDPSRPGINIRPSSPDEIVIGHRGARARRRVGDGMTLNLTPMIDVTFLLLVYFMVATQFRVGEEVYRLDLPDRRGRSVERDPFELDQEPLRIRVATIPDVAGGYRIQLDGPYPQPRSFDELRQFLEARRIDAAQPGGLFLSEHPIVIEPTPATTWQHALATFNAAARAQYTNITLGRAG